MSKTLLAGPFIGELAWEILAFAGHVRAMSKDFDHVVVAARPGHEYLYEDFCTEYIPYDPHSYNTDCELCDNVNHNHFFTQNRGVVKGFVMIFPAQRMPSFSSEEFDKVFNQQEFIKYGKVEEDKKFDIVIHSRTTGKCNSALRNWGIDNWQTVADHFNGKYSIATVGKEPSSGYIKGTEDMMDIDLKELSNVLRSSKLVVGESSGPLHYGALCGTRLVVIVPDYHGRDTVRYNKWNPFNVPFELINKYEWQPPVNVVIETIERNLDEK
jgi:ADP-heptose:LPS heptosyltransferase